MSHTLLMRLAGPMQSWGVSSRFGIRETLTEPSKSGVIGLLCAALGWDRAAQTHLIAGQTHTLADLSALHFGVRVVQEGVVRRDYHTAQNVLRAKAKLRPGKPIPEGDLQQTVLSERYYLADAYFLVGLESDDEALLQALDDALSRPFWPLRLGRKAFLPSLPIRYATDSTSEQPAQTSVVNLPLAQALLTAQDVAWLTLSQRAKKLKGPSGDSSVPEMPALRYIADVGGSSPVVNGLTLTPVRQVQRADVPLSFEPRRFSPRDVQIYTINHDHVPV
ncbi:type I-E CRISPR-associated protein Cas5/CasD [Spirosoma sp. SC4-14]|uniref:type I-E CRISPR-associated protein Cas5/CasD n=1 Tax=Spirosoma sp. SC4-14 TaxID=3128900 RepID=UPI0030CF0420